MQCCQKLVVDIESYLAVCLSISLSFTLLKDMMCTIETKLYHFLVDVSNRKW